MGIDFKAIINECTEAFASEERAREVIQVAEAAIAEQLTTDRLIRISGQVQYIMELAQTSNRMAEALFKKLKTLESETQMAMTFNTDADNWPKITFFIMV